MDPLARLFGSPARLKILRLFVFNDDTSFQATDIAFRSRVPKAAARKELSALLAAGIIKKKASKDGLLYAINKKFPHLLALQEFMRSTTSVSDTHIITSLKKAGSLRMVALAGLFTGAQEPKIDLLVVGDKLDERPLMAAIRALEAELGRELRFASFTTEDFKYRVGVYDRLIRDVFDYSHRTILDRMGDK